MTLRDPRSRILLFSLLFLILFIGLFREFFLTDRLFYSRDMAFLEIPLRQHAASLLKEGRWALWTDAYGNGQPFLANPKNAVLYPGTWLYLFLPFALAFKFHFLFHGFVAWLGLYLLGRSFRWGERASFLAAASFVMGGFYLSSIEFYNHVASLAWLPWILLIARADRPRPVFRTVWLSVLWTLIILSGTPHVLPMALIFGFLAILIAAHRKREQLLVFGASLALAALLAAVQLLPALELVRQSSRDPQETLRWSLEPLQLVNLVVPGILGGDRGTDNSEYWGRHLFDYQYPLYYSLYASPGLLFLALLGLRRPRNRIQVFLAVSAAVFLLFSLAHFLPFFGVIAKLPGVGTIRYPVKYLGGALLALSFLAAIGYDRIFPEETYGRRTTASLLAVCLAALLAFALCADSILGALQRLFVITEASQLAMLRASIIYGLVAAAVYSALLYVASRTMKAKSGLAWLFLCLVVMDLAYSNRMINPVAPKELFAQPEFLADKKKPLKIYRDGTLPDNMMEEIGHDKRFQNYLRQSLCAYTLIGPIHYIYDLDFYGLYAKDYAKIVKRVRGTDPGTRRRILADAGALYAISHRATLNSGLMPKMIEGLPVYFEPVPQPRMFPYLTNSVIKVRSIDEALDLFGCTDFDPAISTIIYQDIPLDSGDDPTWHTKPIIREAKAGLVLCDLEARCRSLAVFSLNPAPGWQAAIDDRPVPVYKANLCSLAVAVPKGPHKLELLYRPASFVWGARLSVVTLLALVLFLAFRIGVDRNRVVARR